MKSDFDANVNVNAEKHNVGLLKSADTKAHAKDASGLQDLQQAAAYKQSTIVPVATRLGLTDCIQ